MEVPVEARSDRRHPASIVFFEDFFQPFKVRFISLDVGGVAKAFSRALRARRASPQAPSTKAPRAAWLTAQGGGARSMAWWST